MGADGPGKAEISSAELVRTLKFCDEWEQASHGGELAHAVAQGLVTEHDVGRIGAVLAGDEPGRRQDLDITTFDSTGLAIQDLAIALAAFDRVEEIEGLGSLEL
jgi:ornithine cyclodeaminase/alanine dehydrogenase-like protein (mu-crystallin family)